MSHGEWKTYLRTGLAHRFLPGSQVSVCERVSLADVRPEPERCSHCARTRWPDVASVRARLQATPTTLLTEHAWFLTGLPEHFLVSRRRFVHALETGPLNEEQRTLVLAHVLGEEAAGGGQTP